MLMISTVACATAYVWAYTYAVAQATMLSINRAKIL